MTFNDKQREIVARKLGYDGPMQGFDNFLNSTPAMGMKYATLSDKFATRMAKGGAVSKTRRKKYQVGGAVTTKATRDQVLAAYQNNPLAQLVPSEEAISFWMQNGLETFDSLVKEVRASNPELAAQIDAERAAAAKAAAAAKPVAATPATPATPAAKPVAATPAAPVVKPATATTTPTAAQLAAAKATTPSATVTTLVPKPATTAPTTAATRAQVLAAYKNNPLAEPNPSEEAINFWMQNGLTTFDKTVSDARAKNPTLASAIDTARKTTTPTATSATTLVPKPAATTATPVPAAPTAPAPKATREQVLAAYKNNPLAEPNPSEEAINFWMQGGLGNFNTVVNEARAQNPALATTIDTTRKTTDNLNLSNIGSTSNNITGAPTVPGAAIMSASQTTVTPGMTINTPVASNATTATPVTTTPAAGVTAPAPVTATKADTVASQPAITAAQSGMQAATGTLSPQAQATAQQGVVTDQALAKPEQIKDEFIKLATAQQRQTGEGELVKPVVEAPTITAAAAQAAAPKEVDAAQGVVQANELVKPAQIAEQDMAQAQAITADGLAPDATVVAAKLDKFSVDEGTLAQAAQGDVNALSTVQGQLSSLMQSFNDGATPAWASGAIRAANAVMIARGLGGSSMAGAAIFQAAMESALPIASQDAQVFQQMGLANLNNRQQVALANAAAQQGLSLTNLSNEQQARMSNAANSFALQSQNLSNMQQTMLANTQIRAALQGQNLSNQQQSAVVNAARYAEQANLNLNNLQQAALHNSSMQVQVDISNASNRQQTALANAQIEAAMQGKVLDNKQQAAVLNAARISENASITFNAQQTATLHNSELMKTIGIANLNAAQATTLANAATFAAMDMANLNARQQTAVMNAQSFLAMDMKNLDNQQQMNVLKSQQIAQAILSDAAAANAASLTNATNATDVAKLNATLSFSAQQFNASEKNKIALADSNAANELAKFNAQEVNDRSEFNSRMSAEISVANAKILADVSVANTAAINAANAINAKNATDLSAAAYAQQSQTYRDLLSYSWKTGESDKDRITNLAIASIQKDVAEIRADSEDSKTTGAFFIEAAKNIKLQDVKDGWAWLTS